MDMIYTICILAFIISIMALLATVSVNVKICKRQNFTLKDLGDINGWIDGSPVYKTIKNRGRVDPGTILELEGGEIYLVGDVNNLLGVCDDCMLDKKIIRYSSIFGKMIHGGGR